MSVTVSLHRATWVASILAVATTGCLVKLGGFRVDRTVEVRRHPHAGKSSVSPDLFAGRHELREDGSVRFVFASDRLCRQERFVDEHTITTTQKRFSTGGFVWLISLASALVVGPVLMFTSDFPEEAMQGVSGLALAFTGAISLPTALGLRYSRVTNPKTTTESPVKTVSDGFEPARCSATLLDEIVLATPWGTTVRGRLDASTGSVASVSFAIDWSVPESIQPTTADGRAQLAGPWKLSVSKQDPTAAFTLTQAELGLATANVARSRERTIAGATPADLSTTGLIPAGGSVVVGELSSLSLTIENRGGTTAKDVTVTTRSSIAQLDLKLAFGTIQPKKRITRTVAVTLPASVTSDAATVVLVFGEASGQVPANLDQQLRLTRSLCAGKRLTRTEYDRKRANLQKAVNDGSMSQDDFNRYDAELVRCLE